MSFEIKPYIQGRAPAKDCWKGIVDACRLIEKGARNKNQVNRQDLLFYAIGFSVIGTLVLLGSAISLLASVI
jgi:hypothetical protein